MKNWLPTTWALILMSLPCKTHMWYVPSSAFAPAACGGPQQLHWPGASHENIYHLGWNIWRINNSINHTCRYNNFSKYIYIYIYYYYYYIDISSVRFGLSPRTFNLWQDAVMRYAADGTELILPPTRSSAFFRNLSWAGRAKKVLATSGSCDFKFCGNFEGSWQTKPETIKGGINFSS